MLGWAGRVSAAGTVYSRRCKADGGPIARSAVRTAPAIGVTLKPGPSRGKSSRLSMLPNDRTAAIEAVNDLISIGNLHHLFGRISRAV